MRKKSFDCVEMKRKAQEQIYRETRDLTREQELEYFHRASERFWLEIEALRKERGPMAPSRGKRAPKRTTKAP